MKKIILVIFLIASLFFVKAETAYACSCVAPKPPQEALEEVTAVFTGKAVEVINDVSGFKINFAVSESWKGVESKIATVKTGGNSAICGVSFEEGKEYIVYARGNKNNLTVSLCSRTALLSEAKEDVRALGEGKVLINPETNETSSSSIFSGEDLPDIHTEIRYGRIAIWAISTAIVVVIVGILLGRKKKDF